MKKPTEPQRPRSAIWSLLTMATVAIVVLIAGLVLSIVSGTIGGVIVITAVFAFAALHYVVWGWWLSTRLRGDEPQESKPNQPEGPDRSA